MTHRVGNEMIGADRAAFIEECAYPGGCNVMLAMMLDLRNGRIVQHLTVQPWDEVSCSTGGPRPSLLAIRGRPARWHDISQQLKALPCGLRRLVASGGGVNGWRGQ